MFIFISIHFDNHFEVVLPLRLNWNCLVNNTERV